ncbi:MAG: hypothetical protein WC107_00290 [Patescibacteria group bacterium]
MNDLKQKNVMLVYFYDQFWRDVAIRLKSEGARISCIVTDNKPFFQSAFKDAQIIDEKELERPERITKLDNSVSLSEKLLKDLSYDENVFLSITDRLSFFPVSVHTRKKVFKELVSYWLYILQDQNIDVIIFPRMPHMGAENVLFSVAKKLKIKTIYIERTLISDRVLLIEEEIEKTKVIAQALSETKTLDEIDPGLYKDVFAESEWLNRSKTINNAVIAKKNKQISSIISANKGLFSRIGRLFKSAESSQFFFNRLYPNWYVFIIVFFYNFKCRELRRFYENNCVAPELQKKFVFFPLHFQVERTTLPAGGVFEDQLLALDILSKSLPKGWVIYVKEHPREFQYWDLRKEHFREIDDYKKMLSYENVILVSIKTDSELLAQKAQVTATITGSIGWENLIKARPVLVFGYPWYLPCQSCYKVGSVDECREAISAIGFINYDKVRRDVLSFVTEYRNKMIISSNDYQYAKKSTRPYDSLVESMAQELKSRF